MRAIEFIVEADTAQPTLAQAAAANRAAFKRGFLQRNPNVAQTVDAFKGTAQAIKDKWAGLKGRAINKSMLASQAAQFADAWEQYAQQAKIDTTDLDSYKDALNDWVTQVLKVKLDRSALDKYVTSANPGAADRYFEEYFIPHYIETQRQNQAAQPQGVNVPAGQRVVVIDPKSKGKYYKTTQGWANEMGQPITKPESIKYLEDLVANDPVRYEPTR